MPEFEGPSIAIIGAGFSGIAAAVELRRRLPAARITIFEREDAVGGTWYVNTYPGCACDIPSHFYSLSFAPNPEWSHHYSRQPEISEYLRRTAEDFGIIPMVKFRQVVTECVFDDSTSVWIIQVHNLVNGSIEEKRFKYVVASNAPLSEPALPNVPGRDLFGGEAWHTSRWPKGVSLEGKRVAVIGTGASAIQIVPEIVKVAAQVTVYQRTAAWISPRWGEPCCLSFRPLNCCV